MTLKNRNLEFVLKKTIADFVADEVKTGRWERMEELLQFFHDMGAEKFDISLPDGEQVATISLMKPKPKTTINQTELVAWLETNGHENLVKTVEVPARTETVLPENILELVGAVETPDGEYVTQDGVPVDGVKTVTPEPSAFTVRYQKGGQERIIQAWRDGELSGIETGGVLPQIEGEK